MEKKTEISSDFKCPLKNLDDLPPVLTDKDLEEYLGLSLSFVNKHSRALGCFKRHPRRYLRDHVLAHLEALAEANQAKVGMKTHAKAANKERVLQLAKNVFESRGMAFKTRTKKKGGHL